MSDNGRKQEVSRRKFLTGMAGIGATALAGAPSKLSAQQRVWDLSADFVTIGAGTSGLAAALEALDQGASVILIDMNVDIGGHGIVSGGNVHLGGGHSAQRTHGIADSADEVFRDWIRPEHRESRYSDRDLVRVFADMNAPTFEWLLENGVQFEMEAVIGPSGASRIPRTIRTVQWPEESGRVTHEATRKGSGLVRGLEKAVRAKGGQILLEHRMTNIIRDPETGRVTGITATHDGQTLEIEGRRGVLVATGGCSSNVNYRRTFDPRLTEEYQVAGEPWSRQTGDGELAAMAIGASLWGTANQTVEDGAVLSKTAHIGCRYGYSSLWWRPNSRVFDQARASGLTGVNWQNAIQVKSNGQRFYNEMESDYEYFAACLSYNGDPVKLNGGGPIWAIFDADAVERQGWDPTPPNVDPDGYFYTADTLAELATRIRNPHQTQPMPAAALQATVARYNAFVDGGVDEDFAKPTPQYRIERPPFFAAWSTPVIHDSLTGLRTNTNGQVIDIHGEVIPGLYASGESQGGFAQHGLARAMIFGRVAGRHAATQGAGISTGSVA
jgi:urocanate reductase